MATSRARLNFSVHTLEPGRGRGEGGEGRIGAGVGGRGKEGTIISVVAVVIHGVVALSWSLLWLLLSCFFRQFYGSGNCCDCCCL